MHLVCILLFSSLTSTGFEDMGERWRSWYEDENFKQELQDLLQQLLPLYQQLHTYVRKRLMNIYPADIFPESGHIPAHLLGTFFFLLKINEAEAHRSQLCGIVSLTA